MRLALAALLAMGCGGAARQVPVEQVGWAELVPDGYDAAGTARARCRALAVQREGFEPIRGEELASFDCDRRRLARVLAEQASDAGASLLARFRCTRRGPRHLGCSATLARRTGTPPPLDPAPAIGVARPAPGPLEVERWDEPRASAAFAIQIDFEPVVDRFERRRRAADEVGERAALPVSHVELGTLTARCDEDECETRELRHGLRIAAGGLGASDLVGVRCFGRRGSRKCVATLAASEADPETDPRAR